MKKIFNLFFPSSKGHVRICGLANRPISDMESDGVYFSDEDKKILQEHREQNWCHYSDLPSVASYGGGE